MIGMGMAWWGTGGFTMRGYSTAAIADSARPRLSRWGNDSTRGSRLSMAGDTPGWGCR